MSHTQRSSLATFWLFMFIFFPLSTRVSCEERKIHKCIYDVLILQVSAHTQFHQREHFYDFNAHISPSFQLRFTVLHSGRVKVSSRTTHFTSAAQVGTESEKSDPINFHSTSIGFHLNTLPLFKLKSSGTFRAEMKNCNKICVPVCLKGNTNLASICINFNKFPPRNLILSPEFDESLLLTAAHEALWSFKLFVYAKMAHSIKGLKKQSFKIKKSRKWNLSVHLLHVQNSILLLSYA